MLSIMFLLSAAIVHIASAHTVITYPGWRGDTLHTSGAPPAQNPDTIGVDYVNGTYEFPYGQEWIYPCKLYHSNMPYTVDSPRRGYASHHQPNKVACEWRSRYERFDAQVYCSCEHVFELD